MGGDANGFGGENYQALPALPFDCFMEPFHQSVCWISLTTSASEEAKPTRFIEEYPVTNANPLNCIIGSQQSLQGSRVPNAAARPLRIRAYG